MNTFTLRLLTAIILFVFSVALCGFDYWMSWADNDATISKLMLWVATHAPVTSMVFSFWAGILTGHLFMPQIPLSEPAKESAMLLFDSLRPSEILRSIGASLFGVATVGFGITHDNIWAAIIGSALGAGSVTWTFGIWLRDRTFVYLRKQNGELWAELSKLSEEMKVMREKQYDDSTATDRRVDQLVARGKLDSREGAHGDTLIEQ